MCHHINMKHHLKFGRARASISFLDPSFPHLMSLIGISLVVSQVKIEFISHRLAGCLFTLIDRGDHRKSHIRCNRGIKKRMRQGFVSDRKLTVNILNDFLAFLKWLTRSLSFLKDHRSSTTIKHLSWMSVEHAIERLQNWTSSLSHVPPYYKKADRSWNWLAKSSFPLRRIKPGRLPNWVMMVD